MSEVRGTNLSPPEDRIAGSTPYVGASLFIIMKKKNIKQEKPDEYVQLVQVSETHPWDDGVMYVGKDGKLHPLIENKNETITINCKHCSK